MVDCKCCRKTISPNAHVCPHCGEPQPAPGPPGPPTLAEVIGATGIDRRTLVAGLAVFVGVGLATWACRVLADRAAAKTARQKALQQKRLEDEDLIRRIVVQQREAGTRRDVPR